MYDLIIRRARLADDTLTDVAIADGKIAAVGQLPAEMSASRSWDLAGNYRLSAGWIDAHVHCYPSSPIYHDEPDRVGVDSGVTSVVDAGSTGSDDIDEFYTLTCSTKTNVFAFLNISRIGLLRQNELADMSDINKQGVKSAIERHSGFVIGIKARMSSSVVGPNGIKPLVLAKEIQQENQQLPLMVHVGNNPPDLDEIADLLTRGDIITHCYNGKPNRILAPAGTLRESVQRALKRGVLLDVGHGTASFSFEVARQAIALGLLPHTISSDIYCRNRMAGPVHSLATVMSKFFTLGMTLPQVIHCVTENAASALRLQSKGQIKPGFDADLTLFEVRQGPQVFADSEGQSAAGEQLLVPLAAVVAGEVLLTDEGKAAHVFDL
ncbi:amidohydrolase/deacetylase family metallohydrolase [Serratia rubidaea]|uniref:amidohydrolase/deacetylase family metallohydrolase n=1 Tax=Serratia rubidaea TaxID=61652 RepID=UPI0023B165D4|nr:amidohydrolase/deacetylase family metallohydrolase [Serratia rubidaea]MDK1705915.1 amidohydrolase/deacetylase family metallohydrolase [Serratia rubidaea]